MSEDIKESTDGQYDAKVGKYDCVEEVKTVLADDGVEETHIEFRVKQSDQWKFAGWNKKNYGEIDWTK